MSGLQVARKHVEGALGRPLIEPAGVEKPYRPGKVEFPALRGVDLTIDDGDMVATVGPSSASPSHRSTS
jgi:putative ABC transport system ATP-binding protein